MKRKSSPDVCFFGRNLEGDARRLQITYSALHHRTCTATLEVPSPAKRWDFSVAIRLRLSVVLLMVERDLYEPPKEA